MDHVVIHFGWLHMLSRKSAQFCLKMLLHCFKMQIPTLLAIPAVDQAIPVLDSRPFSTVVQYSVVTMFLASTVQEVLLTMSVASDNFTSSFIGGTFLCRIMADKSEGPEAMQCDFIHTFFGFSREAEKKSSSSMSWLNLSVTPVTRKDLEVTLSLKCADLDKKNDAPRHGSDVLVSKIDSLLTSVEGVAAANKNFKARIAQLEKSRSDSRPNQCDEVSRTAKSSAQEVEEDTACVEAALE